MYLVYLKGLKGPVAIKRFEQTFQRISGEQEVVLQTQKLGEREFLTMTIAELIRKYPYVAPSQEVSEGISGYPSTESEALRAG